MFGQAESENLRIEFASYEGTRMVLCYIHSRQRYYLARSVDPAEGAVSTNYRNVAILSTCHVFL